VHLTPARIAIWLLAAVAIGFGAFLIGQGGSSHAESPSPQPADVPSQMTLPGLTAVAPLPKMKTPPHHKPKPTETETANEETVTSDTPSEFETYEPVEEEAAPTEEGGGSSSTETAAPPATESTETPSEKAPSGGGEELIGEGGG
jgi:septal ring-binding cell division protein DamX